jgi:hypothetical protein
VSSKPDIRGLERFRGFISDEKLADLAWFSDSLAIHHDAILLGGFMARIATEHQEWNYWQVLAEAHRTFVPGTRLVS